MEELNVVLLMFFPIIFDASTCSQSVITYLFLLFTFFKIQILQLGGTEVGVALMNWRARTPNFIMVMIPGVGCSLRVHPSSLPTAE